MKWLALSLALLLFSAKASAQDREGRVEFDFEFGQRYGQPYARFTNEHWPATLEVVMHGRDDQTRDYASIAFSLSASRQLHEKFRLGLAFELDEPDNDWLVSHHLRDDRAYLYARSEYDFATVHLYYPLASRNSGYDWYFRVAVEDLSYPLSAGFSLTADLDYSPEYGLRDNFGLEYRLDDWTLTAATEELSLGWTGTSRY